MTQLGALWPYNNRLSLLGCLLPRVFKSFFLLKYVFPECSVCSHIPEVIYSRWICIFKTVHKSVWVLWDWLPPLPRTNFNSMHTLAAGIGFPVTPVRDNVHYLKKNVHYLKKTDRNKNRNGDTFWNTTGNTSSSTTLWQWTNGEMK